MKVIVLAAGYGTRLTPLIGDIPKALVTLGDVSVLDVLLARLRDVVAEEHIVLVSNARYLPDFENYLEANAPSVRLLNDGSMTAQTRLGAIRDILFAIDYAQLDDDLLIVAADNLILFDLAPLADCLRDGRIHVAIRHNPDMEDQKRRGVVTLGSGGEIVGFAEKPREPSSPWAAAPLYLLPRSLIRVVDDFIASGGNPDSPGYLMEYLVGRHPLMSWRMPGEILDIGNPDSLRIAAHELGVAGFE